MIKKSCVFLLACLLTPAAVAGDAALGEIISEPCAACHGPAGAKPIANNPILAGQHEKYLLFTLRAYQNGQRANPIMAAQVEGLSRQDLENLAAYYAGQESPLQ